MSLRLIDELLAKNDIPLEAHRVANIKALICKDYRHEHSFTAPRWTMDIIANETCGVDVDKWDYLVRDAYCVGVPTGFDVNRLLTTCRVEQEHLVFHVNACD
eukprot:Filipodium_phascolosomae@DN8707_c0_g1_i1.p1